MLTIYSILPILYYAIYTFEQEQCNPGIRVIFTLHNIALRGNPGQVITEVGDISFQYPNKQ